MGKILRRTFLIGAAAVAGGVAFGTYKVKQDYPNPLETALAEGEATFNPYVKIASDNTISIIVPRAEMGQGVTTTLAALVAEELDVELGDIKVEHGPASYAYFNSGMMEDGVPFAHFDRGMVSNTVRSATGTVGKVLGLQATGGSSSVKDAYEKMRQAGCVAREMLKKAAAEKTDQDVASLKTEAGHVIAGSTKIPYGELASAAANVEPPSDMELRPKSDWKLLGKSQPRTDMEAKVTGGRIFGIDVDLRDMVYATVKMNPRLGGGMKSMDETAALQVPGVIRVVDISGPDNEKFGGGFAVIASNTWSAFKGAEAVKVEWDKAAYPDTSDGIMDVIAKASKSHDGDNLRNDGAVDTAFADAPRENLVEAEYRVPFLTHACMEPMNATAHLRDGKLDIWTGTQAPTIVRSDVAAEVGLEEDKVEIHTTYLGGGFGRRGEVDYPRYAARIAKHTDGKPVKVTWTREEDMTHDTYRPAAVGQMRARVDEKGMPVAFDAQIAAPSIIASVMARTFPSLSPGGPDNTITHGAFDQPYAIADYRVSGIKAAVDIPVGFWRSVGNSYTGYFHESFIDEIATKGKLDPVDMRFELMKDHPTAIGVIKKVAEMSDWKTPAPAGSAKGFAFVLSFGTWVAQVVQVSNSEDGITIDKVWCAADAGEILDPAIFEAQMQSGIVYGLSTALGEAITFEDGMVNETNFDTFDAMRMNQCPKIEVALMENADHMGGAGEPGTPPSIPALANAIAALTGKRIRSMPLSNEVDFA